MVIPEAEEFDTERQLQSMIDNYQNHVIKHHQLSQSGASHAAKQSSGEGRGRHPEAPATSRSHPCLLDHQAE